MSQYTKSTNFATKDNLTPGDPLKVVRGTEIDTEFNNISTAIATKTDNSAAAITGGAIDGATVGATTPATGSFTTLAASGTTTLAGALVGAVTQAAFNTVSTTLNVGGAATAVNLGAATGTATVNNTTLAAKAITASTTLAVTGTSTLTGAVTATAGVTGPITSSSVAITGGSITGITDLAVADGGTGASTAAGGLNNLLPSQTSNANKYLQTDGTNATWDAVTLSTADITGTLGVANGGTGVTTSTGTTNVVLSNSPTLVTPTLGVATATSLQGIIGNVTPAAGSFTTLGASSTATLNTLASSGATLTGGTVNGMTVGATTASTGAFTTLSASSTATLSGLTASTALALDASKNIVSVTNTGTGNNVLATSPTLVTPVLGVATGTSFQGIIGNVTPAAGNFTTLGASSTATLNTLSSSGATLTGGTINGMTVGATTATTGAFTTVSATSTGDFAGVLSRTHAQGTNAYITNTTTGKANTVMGFNDSGATVGGVPTANSYFGTLQNFQLAFISNGALLNTNAYTFHTWNISTAESMRLNATGLGIGTSSPAQKLDVVGTVQAAGTHGAGSFNAYIIKNLASSGASGKISWQGSTSVESWAIAQNQTKGATFLEFNYQGSNKGYFDSSGAFFVSQASGSTINIGNASTSSTTGDLIGALDFYSFDTDNPAARSYVRSYFQDTFGRDSYLTFGTTAVGGNALERVRIDQAGNVTLQKNISVGGATVTTSGTGITFPATQSASTNANTLDDYDEYTATSAACTGAITTAAIWKLTKVGNVVILTLPSVTGTASTSTKFSFGTVIPSKYRPTAAIRACAIIADAGVIQSAVGFVLIDGTSGSIEVYKDLPGSGNFTAALTAGIFGSQTISWTI